MSKLPCGCTPDASGYGYCGECIRKLKEKIWAEMSEDRKNYDRNFAPSQSLNLDVSMLDYEVNQSCSCHIDAPCGYCVEKEDTDDNDNTCNA